MDVSRPSSGHVPGEPDDRDLDEGGLDLTPRTGGAAPVRSRARRRWGALAVLAVLAGALVFIVIQARDATLYFKNADEAVAQREELGTSRFRLQGTVVGEPSNDGTAKVFDVAYNGVSVQVRHTGKEPALFKPGIPVVAVGRWSADGARFDSDELIIKHSEDYRSANRERVDDAEAGSGEGSE